MTKTWMIALAAVSSLGLAAVALDQPKETPVPSKNPQAQPAKQETGKKDKPGAVARQMTGVRAGDSAPDFTLPDLRGQQVNFAQFSKDSITVVEWFNPECPFVVKHHEKNPTFQNLVKEFSGKGIKFIAINSGAPGKQGHGVEKNVKAATEWKIGYPILVDESGEVGMLYGAKTTPHMFIVDKSGKVVYAGAIDNNNSAQTAGDKNFVRQALTEILAGKAVSEPETKPYGCSVKYKSN